MNWSCTRFRLQLRNPTIFLQNPAKSGSSQISSWIWQIPVQPQYVQLITHKTNAADLSTGVITILISATQIKNAKFIAVP